MKYIHIYIVLLLFILPVVAEETDSEFEVPSYTVNESIDFRGTCFLDGDTCTSAIDCTLTVYYPNDTLTFLRENMTFNTDGMYNFTINENLINVTGIYYVYMRCDHPTDQAVIANLVDGSFRVVTKLLYQGGGIMAWETAIPLGLIAIAFIFMYIAANLIARREGIQALFWVTALFIIYASVDVLSKIAEANNQTNIKNILGSVNFGVFIVIFTIVAYLLITFLVEQFRKAGKIK